MSYDIVERLRKLTTGDPGVVHIADEDLFEDAAAEIDRLRELLREAMKWLDPDVYETTDTGQSMIIELRSRIDAALKEQP